MYCENCGTAANPVANFCQKCGHHLHSQAPESVPTQTEALLSPQVPKAEVATPSESLVGCLVAEGVQAATAGQTARTVEPRALKETAQPRPGRRFFARMVDMALATPLIYFLLFYPIGNVPLIEFLLGTDRTVALLHYPLVIGVLIQALWIPFEAASLSAFGTTFGKWAFGLRVTDSDGNRLSYGKALQRALGVFLIGMGLGFPIVSLITGIYCYYRLRSTGVTEWDKEGFSVPCRPWTPLGRFVCAMAIFLALIGVVMTPVIVGSNMARYWDSRGALSPSAASTQSPALVAEPHAPERKEAIDGAEQKLISEETAKDASLAQSENSSMESASRMPSAQDMIDQYNLGVAYLEGRGERAKDTSKAAQWFEKSADQGYAQAQYKLASMYSQGIGGLGQSDVQALKWYRKAANQGFAAAQNEVALAYFVGRGGLAKDEKQAAYWYEKAADQGIALAQNNLALMYLEGRGGLSKNVTRAVELYKKAANQGLSSAQYALGVMYSEGHSPLARNEVEAVKWIKRAANQGIADAQYRLSEFYLRGRGGLIKDEAQAVMWARKSAAQNDFNAQYALGIAYRDGLGGVKKDNAKASEWFKKAADQGHSYAKNELAKIENSLNTELSSKADTATSEEMKLTAAHPDWRDVIRTEQFKYWCDNVISDCKELKASEDAVFIIQRLTQFKAWRRNNAS